MEGDAPATAAPVFVLEQRLRTDHFQMEKKQEEDDQGKDAHRVDHE